MVPTGYRGIVRGGVVLLDEESLLRDGTEVLVTPVEGARSSGRAIVAALDNAPKVPSDWVDELERLIADSQHAPAPAELFGDEAAGEERR